VKLNSVIRLAAAFAAMAVLAGPAPLAAQAPSQVEPSDQWHYLIGLYGWFPKIEGTVTTRNFVQVPIDVTFSELWDHLKMNITGHFEVQRGRFGGGIDAFYVRLGADIDGPIPELIDAEVTMRQFIGEGFGFYQVVRGSGENPWSVDVLGGIRYWNTNLRVDTDIADTSGRTADWVDGFGGVRVQIPLGGCFFLLGRGDAGAGGADLDWSASGDLAFRASEHFVSGAGYRTLNVDYDKPGPLGILERSVWDVGYEGPRVWIAYRW
jgi:hypothetical protein